MWETVCYLILTRTPHSLSLVEKSCCSLKPQYWGALLTWQWSRRRSLTPSTKRVSHRGSLLKGVAVQWVLYQSILNAMLTGRKKLGRKMWTSNRDDRNLENTFKQSRFKHLESFTRSELKLRSQCIKSHHAQTSSKKGYQATSETETSSEAPYLGAGEKEQDWCSVVQSPLFRWK